MSAASPAAKPFRFSSTMTLRESTGVRAVSLPQLLRHLRTMPESVIYYHTHHYLLEHHYLTPEPPNDFAYWATAVFGEARLGEQLASIDTIQFTSLSALRDRLVEVLSQYLRANPLLRWRVVGMEDAFYFIKAVNLVLTTPYEAKTLEEFAACLEAITIESLYFHIFEARLRLRRGPNDFSLWLEQLGEPQLASAVATLDPYTHTMEELRQTLLRLIRRELEHRQRASVPAAVA